MVTDQIDRVRACIYRTFSVRGTAPARWAIADEVGLPLPAIDAAIDALANAHMIVLTPAGREIERALPFSTVPTAFRVTSGPRGWWANCVWDALAIPALLGVRATVQTTCHDCQTSLAMTVDPTYGPDPSDLIAHFLLPARRWYDDLRFT